jgi:hypothetical protein
LRRVVRERRMVPQHLKAMKPTKILSVPGAPLEIR